MDEAVTNPESSTTNEPYVELPLEFPAVAKPTPTAYRTARPDHGANTLALVDDLLDKGRARLHPGWAAGAGAGVGEPDRGDNYIP